MNDWWIRPLVQRSIRQSVRRQLAGVWVRGPVPTGGAVLAPNHHSWWDGYLLAELAWAQAQPLTLLMTARQLRRFPFLSLVGAVHEGQMRSLLRAARAQQWVILFPEAAIQPQGPVRELHPGAAWLAARSGVPLVPVAVRVVMRGAQWPEAFVRFAPPCPPADLPAALQAVVASLDADLAASDPDHPPAGYLRWVQGQGSLHDHVSLGARMLSCLAGSQAT